MGTPLYTTDIIPMTSRPTLTVMDDGDYFVILDTSTGKISKILRTNIQKALNISYDNTTSGLTAENVQAALDELVVNLGSSDSAILALSGRLDTLEGVVDTNRLYSGSQYLALKAQYDAQQIALNASKAELYTNAPILQYGAVEIIGKGYEADDTPIDVSANVVDGKLDMEQKGLTITNLVTNGDFSQGTTGWSAIAGVLSVASNVLSSVGRVSSTIVGARQSYTYTEGVAYFVSLRARVLDEGCTSLVLRSLGSVNITVSNPIAGTWYVFNLYGVGLSTSTGYIVEARASFAESNGKTVQVDGNYGVSDYNLTALGLDHITDTAILAKLLPYVDGTKSVGKMGIQILDADDAVTQTIFLPEVGNRVPNGTADSVKTVSDWWEHSKRVSTPASVGSGVAVNTTNYPTAKNGGQWVNELTAGGTEIGVVGTDSTTGAGMLRFELATPIVTKYDLPHLTSGKTIHRFAGEEKIALYGTGLTFIENVLSVLSAVKFVAGVMTDITSLATITTNTVTFSGVNATDVVYVKVEHDVDRPLGILEHTPAVSNTASRLASLEARVSALEV